MKRVTRDTRRSHLTNIEASKRQAAIPRGPRPVLRNAHWRLAAAPAGGRPGGTLAPAYRDGLAGLPDWQTPPRADVDEARWQDRFERLIAYLEAGNDWPRHKAVITGEEHELGMWLHLQRSRLHRGELMQQRRKH